MSRRIVPADAAAPAPWVDHGVVPPRRLPSDPDAIATYLADALGHPVYERWTWTRLIKVHGALPDARRAKPTVCRLLIGVPEVVEVWQRGRLRALPSDEAASIESVVRALLKSHAGRFKGAPLTAGIALPPDAEAGHDDSQLFTQALPGNLIEWLQRRGRLANPHEDTNTLGASDDRAAAAAFLRERATRSHHTWRAYTTELQRLIAWCIARGLGPLSDLTRQDLLAYRQWLAHPSDGIAPVVSAGQQAPATTRPAGRGRSPTPLNRYLVERSLQPGASVSALAQEHGVNANLLFNWRRLHLRALAAKPAAPPHPALLPVTIVPKLPIAAPSPVAAPSRTPGGTIEIEIGGARVRVRGNVDDASLRGILRALRELA